MTRTAALLAIPLLLIFAGCASAAPTHAVKAKPHYATEQQVASVIVEHEKDWRATADAAIHCRTLWVVGTSAADKANGVACYLDEQTIGLTAQIAHRDLGALSVPPSMGKLVASTDAILLEIAGTDIRADCGSGGEPSDTKACDSALGERNLEYAELTQRLDAWAPYM